MWQQTRLHSQSLPRCMMSGIYSALPSVLLVNVSVASSFDSSPHFKTDNTTTTPAPGICPEGWIEAIEGCFMFHHTGEMDISRYWHFNSLTSSPQPLTWPGGRARRNARGWEDTWRRSRIRSSKTSWLDRGKHHKKLKCVVVFSKVWQCLRKL